MIDCVCMCMCMFMCMPFGLELHSVIFVLLQTGEQVRNMAQGAVGNVKNTLGMGDKK
jgi:alkyl hydroperoxide reductase subunit AhpF